ncbi:MAG: heavy metal-responsive transcriptional regulator, partial [Thermostichales cyanobacterium SZTDM-1c_bins_54]
MALRIKEVAQHLGLNPQTIYFYERLGLLPNLQRSRSGYRLFSDQDVERLRFIKHAKHLGLTLEEIKDILTLKDGRQLTCQALHQRLQRKITAIRQHIHHLQVLHDQLLSLLDTCQWADPSQACHTLDLIP